MAKKKFELSMLDEIIKDEQDIEVDIYGFPTVFTVKYLTITECLIASGNMTLIKEVQEASDKRKSDEDDEQDIFNKANLDAQLANYAISAGVTHIDGEPVSMTYDQARKLPPVEKTRLFDAITGNHGGEFLTRFQEGSDK